MTTVDQLLKEYGTTEREISALSKLLLILVAVVLARIGWLAYTSRFEDAWTSIAALGALVSAVLVSKAATRLILHVQIIREDDRRKEVVRTTNHAMVVLNKLTDLVNYVHGYVSSGEKPAAVLIGAISEVEEKWEVFYEKDLNQHLSAEAFKLVRGMAGSFFGMSALRRGLEAAIPQSQMMNPLPKSFVADSIVRNLETLQSEMDKLYKELEKIRTASVGEA